MRGSGATPRSRIKIVLGSELEREPCTLKHENLKWSTPPVKKRREKRERPAQNQWRRRRRRRRRKEEEDEERLMSWELQGLGKRFEFSTSEGGDF
mmetsp:Transcript_10421/g.29117  ORF Transcript_10421/g.29117 Transcript_10421/m.29117 type:complete len:95 (-) Transcript_10421:135-419(-)